MAAGNLIILAEVDNAPLPQPLEVEGSRMKGEGTIYYQASLPMKNRSALTESLMNPAATQPAAQPAAANVPADVPQNGSADAPPDADSVRFNPNPDQPAPRVVR
jgi:hypothetical protein